jgi:hypothetical protein
VHRSLAVRALQLCSAEDGSVMLCDCSAAFAHEPDYRGCERTPIRNSDSQARFSGVALVGRGQRQNALNDS